VAVGEAGSGADEGDEVGRVHRTPPGLGGFDELERHRQAGRASLTSVISFGRSG
jgi:hypothetical protein